MPKEDPGIETLLLLDGEIYDQGDGYWIKIEARRLEPDEHVPHGIRYALTLHDFTVPGCSDTTMHTR